jgi:hypothetical protein
MPNYEYPCPGPITIDVRNAAGVVEVRAEPRETATVEVEPFDDRDESQEAADRTRVELSGDTLLVATPELSGWPLRRTPRLRVTARVPADSSGRFRVASADVTCHGEWAHVKVNTASGDTHLERAAGDLTVNSASGDVQASYIGGRLTVKTASGDVSARQVIGSVDVKSASGDVQLDEAGGDVVVKTASGDTGVGAARRGTIRANTVSGDVSVGVVSGTGVWLDLNSLSGRTQSDLAMSGETTPATHELTVQVGTISGNIDVHRVTLPTAA